MEAFRALADPTRRQILELLKGGPMDASDIASRFAVSKPAISNHLKRLHAGALVTRTVDAQRRVYALDRTGLDEVEHWISEVRSAWEGRLDGLEAYLQEKKS